MIALINVCKEVGKYTSIAALNCIGNCLFPLTMGSTFFFALSLLFVSIVHFCFVHAITVCTSVCLLETPSITTDTLGAIDWPLARITVKFWKVWIWWMTLWRLWCLGAFTQRAIAIADTLPAQFTISNTRCSTFLVRKCSLRKNYKQIANGGWWLEPTCSPQSVLCFLSVYPFAGQCLQSYRLWTPTNVSIQLVFSTFLLSACILQHFSKVLNFYSTI